MKKFLTILAIIIATTICAYSYDDTKERASIYYRNGVTYLKEKKYSSAILEFKKVLRVNPYNETVRNSLVTAYTARAQYYANIEGSHKKAINDLRSALTYLKYWDNEVDPSKLSTAQKAEETLKSWKNVYAPLKNADAINLEAQNLRKQGELAAALYEYQNLFNNANYAVSAYSASSDIYLSLNNDKMAIQCIRDAILNKKQDGMLHFKYALILEDIGNEDAAMDEYSRALEYSNNNKELLSALQNLWMARTVQNPNDSQALINLGAVLQKQNQFELARAQYIKARQINPNDPVILINLASVYTAENDYDNALKIYDEIISKNKNDLSARFYKGKLYEKKGDIQSAIKQYEEILSLKNGDANAKEALNSLLSNLSGEQLTGYLQKEADSNPSNYDAQFKYAFEMHKNKAYLAAIEYYKRAIAVNSNHSEPYINLAQIYIIQKDYKQAEDITNRGLAQFPDNNDLKNLKDTIGKTVANEIFAKGTELYNNKNFTGALEYYLKIPYQTPEILSIIASCYYESGDNERALEYYNKILSQNPKDETALLMAANALMNQNKQNEAKEYLNKLLTINPNNADAKNTLSALNEGQEGAMLDSAIGLYEAKNYQNALDILNKIIAQNPKNAYALYYKGVIFDDEGKTDSAIVEYKKSIQADPKFSLGYYMIAVAFDTKENYKEAAGYYDKYIELKAKEGVEDEYSKYAKTRTKELKDFLSQN